MTTAARRRRGTDIGLLLGVAAVAVVGAGVAIIVNPVVVVAALIALVGAVAIVEDPRIGALAIAGFAILRLADVATDFHGAPSTFTPLLALITVAIVARALRSGERPTGGGRAAFALAALCGVAIFSLPSAGDLDAGYRALVDLVKDGSVAIIIGVLVTSTRTLRQVVWVLLGGGAFLAALSVLQFVTGSFGSAFGGFAQSEVQHVFATTDEVRISGPIGDPNFYAQWLVLLVPLAMDRFHDETSSLLRWLAAATALMSVAVIIITFSRGALLALVVVVGAMLLRHPPRLSTVAAILAVGLLSIPFLPPGYVDRTLALTDIGGVDIGTDPSLRAREAEIAVGVEMFLDDPLTGIGYGNYLPAYSEYARGLGIEQTNRPREAHNLYLETAAETGVPGVTVLGLVFTGVFYSIARGRRMFRAMGDHMTDGIGYAVAVALMGYLVTSIFLHMAFSRPAWLLIGLALAFPALARAENTERDRSRTGAL